MKIPYCYNCKTEKRTFYAEENGFSLMQCSNCGLLYLDERPDDNEISQAHKQGKHSGKNELDVTGEFNTARIPFYLNALEDIFKGDLGNKKTWLDVGCGHGEFMTAVQEYSHEELAIRGTEPNINKQKSAHQRNLNVSFFDIESHKEKYDIISLLNVYSHLPNPPEFIELLKNHLNPEGEIIIETGDTANFPAKDHHRPFYLPDHISFASEGIVLDILKGLDLEIVSVNKYPYLKLNEVNILKETVKSVLPQYQSKLKYFVRWNLYSRTDMFIRARLKESVSLE